MVASFFSHATKKSFSLLNTKNSISLNCIMCLMAAIRLLKQICNFFVFDEYACMDSENGEEPVGPYSITVDYIYIYIYIYL